MFPSIRSRKSQCYCTVEVQTEFGRGDCWFYQSLRDCIPRRYIVWDSRSEEDVLCIQGYSCDRKSQAEGKHRNNQEIQGHLGRHDQ